MPSYNDSAKPEPGTRELGLIVITSELGLIVITSELGLIVITSELGLIVITSELGLIVITSELGLIVITSELASVVICQTRLHSKTSRSLRLLGLTKWPFYHPYFARKIADVAALLTMTGEWPISLANSS